MAIIWQPRTPFHLGFVHIPLNNVLGNLKFFFVHTVYHSHQNIPIHQYGASQTYTKQWDKFLLTLIMNLYIFYAVVLHLRLGMKTRTTIWPNIVWGTHAKDITCPQNACLGNPAPFDILSLYTTRHA